MAIGVELAAVGVELIPGIAGSDNLTVGTSTITGGTNGRILYDNSGVLGELATTGANSVVLRDSNQNIFINNYFANAASTVSAAGTTVLTAASARYQALTGSSSQTYQLPDATTLQIGLTFVFNNNSSGSLTITNAGGSTLYTVPAGGLVQTGPTNIGSTNGTWDFHPYAPSTVTWGSGTTGLVMNSVLSTTPAVLAGASGATSPSFIPQRGTPTTGYGGDSTHLYGVVGGATVWTAAATGVTAAAFKTSTALVTATDGSNTAAFTANMVASTGGPTTAAQNGWLKMQDSTGATVWVPVWK